MVRIHPDPPVKAGTPVPGLELNWESACFASRRSSVRSRPAPPVLSACVDPGAGCRKAGGSRALAVFLRAVLLLAVFYRLHESSSHRVALRSEVSLESCSVL